MSKDKNNGIATFTVRELAEELGISRQAVHKKINQLYKRFRKNTGNRQPTCQPTD